MKNFKLLLAVAVMTPVLSLAVTPYVTDLTADGGSWDTKVDVGDVTVTNTIGIGAELNVTYSIAPNLEYDVDADPVDNDGKWCIDFTHTDVQASWLDIPQTRGGNTILGKFAYHSPELDCVSSYSEIVTPIPENDGTVDIAAHADVKQFSYGPIDQEALDELFPRDVTMKVIRNIAAYSFFDIEITEDPELLDGTHMGWCVCAKNPIYQDEEHNATARIIGDPVNASCMSFPEKLPLVEYIINHYKSHTTSALIGDRYLHVCDVQNAIWEAMDDPYYITAGLPHTENQCGGWYVQETVDAIVADARANGADYVPGCDDRKLITLVPDEDGVQSTVIDIPVPCEGSWGGETAWGGVYTGGEGDYEFPGSDWSYYFPYTVAQ